MVEVGTTNRTHPKDYERAINEHTAAGDEGAHQQLRACRALPAAVGDAALAGIAHATRRAAERRPGQRLAGRPRRPRACRASRRRREEIEAGFDVVTFSGDKLLGGPQAGLIVGRKALLIEPHRAQFR